MRKIVNFLQGSVRIRVIGAFPERFLNLCGTENFRFWDVEQENRQTFVVTIPRFYLSRAKKIAGQAMCTVEKVEDFGLPAFLFRFRSRYALLAGLFFAIFCAAILSQFILVVDVTGNTTLPDSVILTELESLGFGIGTYGPGVDRRTLANEALLRLRELSFLSVNISGVYAQVVVREATAPPELEDRWAPTDIVAATDGVVVDVDPLIGKPLVEEGDAVLAGEVLISSVETYESGDGTGQVLSSSQVRAEGQVWAQTFREVRAATPLSALAKKASGREKTVYALKFLKHTIKFYQNSSISELTCDKIKHAYALTLPGGTVLPLAWEVTELVEYETASAAIDRDSAEAYLKNQLDLRLAALIGEDGQVMSRNLTYEETDGTLTATLKASCLEQIGRAVPLE